MNGVINLQAKRKPSKEPCATCNKPLTKVTYVLASEERRLIVCSFCGDIAMREDKNYRQAIREDCLKASASLDKQMATAQADYAKGKAKIDELLTKLDVYEKNG